MSTRTFRVSCCAFLLATSNVCGAERTEHFDTDPKWHGHNNRSSKPEPREIRQDFGFSATTHAGGTPPGGFGGFITPAAETAFYAKKIPERTFADPLSASGIFNASGRQFHVLVGFFNASTVNEWRTPNSIAIRLQGRGEHFYAYVEYTTSRWRAGGDNPGGFALVPDEERPQRMRLKGFAGGKAVHRWSLKYDPAGNGGTGSVTVTMDDETAICHLDPGHQEEGATFNRFGLLTVMKQADTGGEVWLDDITINGERESFDRDPAWDAVGNRRTYTTGIVRPRFDFGYSPTHFAGGSNKGEMGGMVHRGDGRYPQMMGFYGDRLEELSLAKPLRASGRISLRRAVSDSDVLLGFFHAEHSLESGGKDAIGLPPDFLGVSIGGPSREGFMVSPTYRLHNTERGSAGAGPHILPDGAPHTWTLKYAPPTEGAAGSIIVTLDEKEIILPVLHEHLAIGAHFNRFGLITPHIDGNSQHLYFDDFTYTWSHAELPPHRTLKGHAGSVLWLAFSPDGQLLASASRDSKIKLWDAATGELRDTLEGHTADVSAVAFTADGQTLISGAGDRTIGVWDVCTAKLTRTIEAHDDVIRAVVLSPDGKLAASTGVDLTVRLWDAAPWEKKATLPGHTNRVKSLAFTRDGKILASGGDDRTVRIWDVAGASLVTTWEAHPTPIETLAFSPDGTLLATSSNDTTVKLWRTADWSLQHTLEGHRAEVDSIAFSPDGQTLISGSKDRMLKLWDSCTGALLRTFAAHEDRIESLAFSPAGKLATGGGGKDWTIKLWDALLTPPAAK